MSSHSELNQQWRERVKRDFTEGDIEAVYIDDDDYVLDVSKEEAIDIAVKGKKVKRRGKPANK